MVEAKIDSALLAELVASSKVESLKFAGDLKKE